MSEPHGETIGDVIARRYNRRDMMAGVLGVTAVAAVLGPEALAASESQCSLDMAVFSFDELGAGADDTHHVADGYRADCLLRWGDPIEPGLDPFDPLKQTPGEQAKRFGYNNDYIAYFPLDENGAFVEGDANGKGSNRGLLCINNEYVNGEMMFPDVKEYGHGPDFKTVTDRMVEVEMEAIGVTIVEVKKSGDQWAVDLNSPFNRRITANAPMTIDGPVANDDDALKRLVTKRDPSGKSLEGTLANCAGGRTPWGTYLTAEENIQYVFYTREKDANGKPLLKGQSENHPKTYKRYDMPAMAQAWGRLQDRFNVDKEPNEPNRFGWIVEIDPFDRKALPVKHTALGRFFHEGAEIVLTEDKRAVVFSGDDAKNEYVYRFVSEGTYEPGPKNKQANMQLLSSGTLYAAKFNDDGSGVWLPLKYGDSALTEAGSDGMFKNQGDVMIDARFAADVAGATKMDRPEDVQPNEKTKRIYVMLTNNDKRTKVDEANPRLNNPYGHIIEIVPDGGDFAADTFAWDILVRCGDPRDMSADASWNAATSTNSWFVCPDNAVVDDQGRLWIATDQGREWQEKTGRADGLYALETDGIRKGTPRMFFRVPRGAELCGPCFTPDGETLFVSVQHPGTDGIKNASFKTPGNRWPDFIDAGSEKYPDGMPPRPSVMVITKEGGGKIG